MGHRDPRALLPALSSGNDDLMTRDRPRHQTPAGALSRSRQMSDPHVNSVGVELARLNEALGEHLSLYLEHGEASAVGRVLPRASGRRHGLGTAVLVAVTSNGARRTARCPVAPATRRRRQLLALAASIAECAMQLGLGTGLYRPAQHGQAPPSDDMLWPGPGAVSI